MVIILVMMQKTEPPYKEHGEHSDDPPVNHLHCLPLPQPPPNIATHPPSPAYLCGRDIVGHVHHLVVVDAEALDLGHDRGLDGRVSYLVGLLMDKHPAVAQINTHTHIHTKWLKTLLLEQIRFSSNTHIFISHVLSFIIFFLTFWKVFGPKFRSSSQQL